MTSPPNPPQPPSQLPPGAPQKLNPGDILGGRYRIDTVIGQGGMGIVYKAHDLNLNRAVAIKQLLRTDAVAGFLRANPGFDFSNFQQFFRQEARLLTEKGLKHPHLVEVQDYLETSQGQFSVMNYVQGKDLADHRKAQQDGLRREDLIKWMDQLFNAVVYLHENGIIHRDIKPQNLILDAQNENITLIDFGLAKTVTLQTGGAPVQADGAPVQVGAPSGQSTITIGSLFLTPTFASPEQLRGEPTDEQSDIYSIGRTLAFLLYGDDLDKVDPQKERDPLNQFIVAATHPAKASRYLSAQHARTALTHLARPDADLVDISRPHGGLLATFFLVVAAFLWWQSVPDPGVQPTFSVILAMASVLGSIAFFFWHGFDTNRRKRIRWWYWPSCIPTIIVAILLALGCVDI